MEPDAPPPPPPCTSSAAAAAVTGVGDPSSSSAARALRRLASSAQPELTHSSPSLVPPPPPSLRSSESASASPSSSAAVPSYQQRPPPPAPVLDGSSLHARSFSHPPPVFSSFNTVGNILSTDQEAAAAAVSQLAAPLRSLGGHQGQSNNNLFGIAPSASEEHSSFLSSAGRGTMGNTPFPHLGASPPAATPLAMAHPSLLGGQQQQALPWLMTPGMLLGQSNSFCGFRQYMLDQGSSSRSAGLPPRWQPPSRTETNPTFGSVQPSSDELVRLPPSLQMRPLPRQEAAFTLPGTNVTRVLMMGPFEATPQGQPLPGSSSSSCWEGRLQLGGSAHTVVSAWSTYGSVSNNGQSSAAMSTGPWHCRNLSGESSTMSSMPRPPSVGDKGSPGPPPSKGRKRRGDTFTDAEMEKIGKEKRLSDLVITDPRRVKTILCNRASAKKSAERRESHRRGLQQQLQALDIEYTQLHGLAILQQEKLAELESQTSKLRTRLEDLDNELKLKEAINETLVSSIQSITLADSNARSGLPQQMTFSGQCSNGGQYQHMRNNPQMSSQMVQMQQPPEIQEETITTTTRPGSKTTT